MTYKSKETGLASEQNYQQEAFQGLADKLQSVYFSVGAFFLC